MITTPATATASGVLALLRLTIVTQTRAAVARGVSVYVDRDDTIYVPVGDAIAQGPVACIRRTDIPSTPRVSVALALGITAVNSTQRIEAV